MCCGKTCPNCGSKMEPNAMTKTWPSGEIDALLVWECPNCYYEEGEE